MRERQCVEEVLKKVKIGMCLEIEGYLLRRAFPCGWPSMYRNTEQAFLSTRIGSAWGSWRIRRSLDRDSFIISHHEESTKRYYVDPDQEWLYDRASDGTLELKKKYKGTPKRS